MRQAFKVWAESLLDADSGRRLGVKKRRLALAFVLVPIVILAGCGGGGGGAASDPLIVRTQQGMVQGASADDVISFKGIPFASPPVGALRWKAPAAAPVRSEIYRAASGKPGCSEHEDCLYLNIHKPADAVPGENLPVFLWIHGGGFSSGNGTSFDGTALAAENRLVVVTITYRLSSLGFLAHPALTAEDSAAATNFAMLDQQAAMGWVKDNIGFFGGNPDNVTIGGESGGAVSVGVHMASPLAAGLFHRALLVSNGPIRKDVPLAEAESHGMGDAAGMGCPGTEAAALACLRNLPFATVRDKMTPPTGKFWSPVIDGHLLKESTATAFMEGRFTRVPTIMGAMRNELSLMAASFSEPLTPENYAQAAAENFYSFATAEEVKALYPVSKYPTPTHAATEAIGDSSWYCGSAADAEHVGRVVPSTWQFEFAEKNPAQIVPDTAESGWQYPGPIIPSYGSWGDYHSASNAYWFGKFASTERTSTNIALSAVMRKYLANFARSGDPNGSELPAWRTISASGGMGIAFATPVRPEADVTTPHNCNYWKTKPLMY